MVGVSGAQVGHNSSQEDERGRKKRKENIKEDEDEKDKQQKYKALYELFNEFNGKLQSEELQRVLGAQLGKKDWKT